jgi:hypothetical protein
MFHQMIGLFKMQCQSSTRILLKRNPLLCKKIGNQNANKVDWKLIIDHINSFKPTISHYKRDHGPDTRYLLSDITIKLLYLDFLQKNPTMHFSYNLLYKEVVTQQNTSLAKLGTEECWCCEEFNIHEKSTGHKKDSLKDD